MKGGAAVELSGACYAALLSASGVGIPGVERLALYTGGARGAWNADADALRRCLGEAAAAALLALRREKPELPETIAEESGKRGIRILVREDAEYPAVLREIAKPPLALFVRGNPIPDAERIAVVGSRHASLYGKRVAEEIAMGLAGRGVTVVSGAARGIDTAAHKGALREGRTVAVLGCGADVAYPKENARLLDEIASSGAVISEYPPGTQPFPAFFPQRNRIISGLSRGTTVVEAAERSGSLITAEFALSEGRDVFAVPGSIYSDTSRGCHRLIQQGAKLTMAAEDILEEYPWAQAAAPKERPTKLFGDDAPDGLSEEEQRVYELLSKEEALTVDDIIYRMHGRGNASNVAFLLLQMALKGFVEEDENHAYSRVAGK